MRDELLGRFTPVLAPGALRAFTILIDTASEVVADGKHVHCAFPAGSWVLRDAAPTSDSRIPEQLRKFLAVCGGFQWGEIGDAGQLVLHSGFDGTVEALGDAALKPARFGFSHRDACAPIDIGLGAFYCVHPVSGRLLFRDEGPIEEVVDTVDPVEVYLRELSYELKDVEVKSPFQTAPHRSEWLREWRGAPLVAKNE